MKIKSASLTLLMLIPGLSFASGGYDTCTENQTNGSCYFGSYSLHQNPVVYFNCTTNESTTLDILSKGVLISGFQGGKISGTGRFNIIDKNLKKTLNKFYFEVHRNTLYPLTESHIRYAADKDIHCEIGKGDDRSLFSSEFG